MDNITDSLTNTTASEEMSSAVMDETNFRYEASNLASIILLLLIIPSISFSCFIIWRKIEEHKRKLAEQTRLEVKKFLQGESNIGSSSSGVAAAYRSAPYNAELLEIDSESLIIDKDSLLGSGAYGLVYKGMYKTEIVAIKTLKPNADLLYFKSLLSELKIMIVIGEHENIIRCLGAVTKNILTRKLDIVVEFCKNGSLEKFLRNGRSQFRSVYSSTDGEEPPPVVTYENVSVEMAEIEDSIITDNDLLQWAIQICEGMTFLARKEVVHGDLATRNVLLTDTRIVKITDFGLSQIMFSQEAGAVAPKRSFKRSSTYRRVLQKNKQPLPWRWLALETIKQNQFTTKSDVWAYGVTLWEIFSLAQVPYPGILYSKDFVSFLQEGGRLRKPNYCGNKMYDLISKCWYIKPEERPNFSDLREMLMNTNFAEDDDG